MRTLFVGLVCFALVAALLLAPATAEEPEASHIHHYLTVRLEPGEHRISGTDSVTLPAGRRAVPVRFRAHAGLDFEAGSDAWAVRAVDDGGTKDGGESLRMRTWEARPASGDAWPGDAALVLRFQGVIHHPVVSGTEEYARSFSETPGTIEAQGVVISGSTAWVPAFEARTADEALITFTLMANVPADWDVVSQGRRAARKTVAGPGPGRRLVAWECPHPMDEVYLIAAPFTTYERSAGGVALQAFLREPDPNLAGKYLEATAQYLDMYRKLLGPYPFEKFALVENFWETGYGMPSFTLLGPQVIRFPFILHSSYPHEILHNWWGNSVYVDWAKGNWCEGLTAYLADHLIREGQGRGAEYRNDTLKAYRNYVGESRDFPLTDFRSRHSSATQAVGYGKCLMLWHMLRVRLGDEGFVRALQRFYGAHRFRVAAWSDIEPVFSQVAGEDLAPFFAQWTARTGALRLSLDVEVAGEELRIRVRQAQGGEPYAGVTVPVVATLADGSARSARVVLNGPEAVTTMPRVGVVRVDVDPEFDVFRTLDLAETPPTLSEIFGAEHVTLVVPSGDAPLAAEWAAFARSWAEGGRDVQVVAEDALAELPAGRAVWALGATNRFGPRVIASLADAGAQVNEQEARFGVESVPRASHAFVYVARHPADPALAAGWIGADVAASLPGLGRKLPHYGKYSYLAFAGAAPDNVVKGTWPVASSPLVAFVGDGAASKPARGTLPVRPPLAKLAPVFDPARLAETVKFLADDAQEGRGVGSAGLERSQAFIAKAFADAGLKPDPAVAGAEADGWFQTWTEEGGPDGKPVTLANVIGVIPGSDPSRKGQTVVVGAHYDHLGRGWPDCREGNAGQVHNGADDNASGVAVLLEVARVLGSEFKPARTIVFVAFSGEEWGLKGSRRFAATYDSRQRPLAMINLDTVGRLRERKLMVLGAGTATEWRHIAMGIGFTTGVESTCVADDPGGSDQVAFHEIGVPAVQLFSGPHEDYHRPGDDVDKVDADGLVKAATWLREAVVYLAERPEPLTSTLGGAKPPGGAPAAGARRASLGTMPDFAFAGPGVRVESVIPGSPAESAGLAAGDVIVSIDGQELADLKAYSGFLKGKNPGDKVKVRVRRGEEVKEVEAVLGAR